MKSYACIFENPAPDFLFDESGNLPFYSNPFDAIDVADLVNESGDFDKIAEAKAAGDIRSGTFCDYTAKLEIGNVLPVKSFSERMIDFAVSNYSQDCDVDSENVLIGHDTSDVNVSCNGDGARIGIRGASAKISTFGDSAKIAVSGYNANVNSFGPETLIYCDGIVANITSNGHDSQIASLSRDARIYSSGNNSRIRATGYGSNVFTTGKYDMVICDCKNGIVSCIGEYAKVRAGVGCWVTLAERDSVSGRIILKTEYVDGERIRSDKFYGLQNGNFVELY